MRKLIFMLTLFSQFLLAQQTHGINIPTAHPRLWWTPARLQQARAWYTTHAFTPTNSSQDAHAVESSFRYLMTGETSYARDAINWAVGVSGNGRDNYRWNSEAVFLTFDWCYDQLTPAEKSTLISNWNTYTTNNGTEASGWGGVQHVQNDYFWGYLRSEIEWAIASYGDNTSAAETFLNRALDQRWVNWLPHETTTNVLGTPQEGSQYGRYMYGYPIVPFVTMQLNGRDIYSESSYFRNVVYWLLYATPPQTTYLLHTSSRHYEVFPHSDDQFFISAGGGSAGEPGSSYGTYNGDFMTTAANRLAGSNVGRWARQWLSMTGAAVSKVAQSTDNGGTPLPFTSLPTDYFDAGPGWLYSRTSWGNSATLFSVQGQRTQGPVNLGTPVGVGHTHYDFGNWTIWRNGRWLSKETTGYFSNAADSVTGYGGTGTIENYRSEPHNVLFVNRKAFADDQQNNNLNLDGGSVVKRLHRTTDFSYVNMDLTGAYRNNRVPFAPVARDNAAVNHLEREFIFLRGLESVVILDRVLSNAVGATTAAGIVKGFLMHFEASPTIEDAQHVSLTDGDQFIRLSTLVPSAPSYRIVNEMSSGGANGQFRLEVETSGAAQSYFLQVVQARDASGQNVSSTLTDNGSSWTLDLSHPTLGTASLVLVKGASSTGGSLSINGGAATTLRSDVQAITASADGLTWQGAAPQGPGDTTPPTLSSMTATNVTTSTATINWTTDEPADSRVDYGTTTAYGQTTALDASLVTSHSVNLSGLVGSTGYHYRVRSSDASSNPGVSGDFTFTTAAGAVAPTQYTITASAGSGGAISPSGSVAVISGGSQTFTITPQASFTIADVSMNGSSVGAVSSYTFNNVTANQTIASTFQAVSQGAPSSSTMTLTVFPYAAGNGPVDLVSNAIPFKPGALIDPRNVQILDGTTELSIAARSLAVWPQDGSIRSLLIQFNAPFTAASKVFTARMGSPRTTTDRAFIAVTWDLPRKIFTLPASDLSDSLVAWEQKPLGQSGFPAWETKQINSYSAIDIAIDPAVTCARYDQYYDTANTNYQLYTRTGDMRYLANGRRWALHHRRNQVWLSGPNIGHGQCPAGDYLTSPRYVFPQGLSLDYFMFGDEEAKRVAGVIVDNFLMTHPDFYYYRAPNTRGFFTEREPAFALMGILAYYELTNNVTYLNRVRDRLTSLHQMQVDNGRRAWVHNLYDHDPSEGCAVSNYGSSPWMSGLLLEAVIKYHKLTGDPMASDSLVMALDDLRARDLATTGSTAGRSFLYLGCPAYTDGVADLDNMISHAYGYGFKITGNTTYRTLGTTIFNTGVTDSYTGDHKHYNQQFRSSGQFVAYIAAPPVVTSRCDLNADGRTDGTDVQGAINQSLGVCSNADLHAPGQCNVVDVQRVINASLGQPCRTGP